MVNYQYYEYITINKIINHLYSALNHKICVTKPIIIKVYLLL